MSTTVTIDIDDDESDETNSALPRARNEGRPDDGNHTDRAELEHVIPQERGPSFPKESNAIEEPNKTARTNEESKRERQKMRNTKLLQAIKKGNNELVSSLLEEGASPNATHFLARTTASHIAAFFGNGEALRILLEAGADRNRGDFKGLSPLHYAAWANEPKCIARLLGFPEEVIKKMKSKYCRLTSEQETEIHEIGAKLITSTMINFTGKETTTEDYINLPDECKTHDGGTLHLKVLEDSIYGNSALHLASAATFPQCVQVLLAAGADPNVRSKWTNKTPLGVAGTMKKFNREHTYVETLYLLCKYGGRIGRHGSRVLEIALERRSLQALVLLLDAGAQINHRNPEGYTPVHLCVKLRQKVPLKVLLNYNSPEMDYRAVDVTDKTGSTVLHWAALRCWPEGATVALLAGVDITHENVNGDTALHLAAITGSYDIVKQILDTKRQCDLSKENKKGDSPFSNAILSGNADIVKLMLVLDDNLRDHFDRKVGESTPLIYAAENKFLDLFILILHEQRAFLNKDQKIHVMNTIAKHNLRELFLKIEDIPYARIKYKDIVKNFALCEAIKHNNREMILVLLEKGADLSQQNADDQTAISLLMYHVTKPTEFMTELLDKCIKANKNIYDKNCVITINYSLLMPFIYEDLENENGSITYRPRPTNDMRVLEALIETGDVYNQRSLLTHPVVESFLYLKWKKSAKFIYFLLIVYSLLLISLNTFIGTIYYHMDHKIKEQDITWILSVFNPIIWRYLALTTLCLSFLVNLFFWTSSTKKWYYIKTIWIKLLIITGGVIMIFISMDAANTAIIRGVAVVTVSLSWLFLMMYLSWTPTLGYYMQMYGKVSINVIKVLLSFSFPVVSFSICFMILLRSEEPFDGPVAAFLKTMVMMSSEFEYENLVENTITDSPEDVKNSTFSSPDKDEPLISVYMLRIFFLLFFVCVAIVLMNLMLGVAVSDIQELSRDGKQRRLMKQVECISMLEKLFKRKPLSMFKMKAAVDVPSKVEVRLNSKIFGREMKETIMNKAQSLKETEEKKAGDVSMKAKIDDIFDLSKKLEKSFNKILEAVALKDNDTSEKTIEKAVNRILEAIANDKRSDRLSWGQKK